MADERYVLAFEGEGNQVGDVAMRLLRLGFDVLYARSAEEAWLLARQEAAHIHTLLFPPGVNLADLGRLAHEVQNSAGGRAPILVVAGERPDETVRKALREAGVVWAIWDPGDDAALRFAVGSAISLPSELQPRGEPRVPTSRLTTFYVGDKRRDAVLYSLSERGAFLETSRPAPPGTGIAVEMTFPDRQLQTLARVLYATPAPEKGLARMPGGMGIVFEGLSEEGARFLRSYVSKRSECFLV